MEHSSTPPSVENGHRAVPGVLPSWRELALALAICSVIGLLQGAHFALDLPSRGVPLRELARPLLAKLVEELTGTWGAALLFFPLRAVALRFRLDRAGWWRAVPAHLLALPVLAGLHTLWMWGSRQMIFPLVGLGRYDYGFLPWRLAMELPTQAIMYSLATAGVYVASRVRLARQRETRALQLESRLAHAQLENLELRLRPHFLFNALNTIASTMYTDPRAADEMIGHLAELLRRSLTVQDRHEVSLGEELSALEHYVSLVRARFGDALAITVEADPAALELAVPSLILQPLVENAVRHGRASSDGVGTIEVTARRRDARLVLSVRDDGPGETGAAGTGLGLSATEERLALLYGDGHSLRAGHGAHGFEVEITLPARPAVGGG